MIEHDHTFSTYTYCNFNQFTQRNLSDTYQVKIKKIKK